MPTDGVRGREGGTPDDEAFGVRPEEKKQSRLSEMYGWGLTVLLIVVLAAAFVTHERRHRIALEEANHRANLLAVDLELAKIELWAVKKRCGR